MEAEAEAEAEAVAEAEVEAGAEAEAEPEPEACAKTIQVWRGVRCGAEQPCLRCSGPGGARGQGPGSQPRGSTSQLFAFSEIKTSCHNAMQRKFR